MNSCELDARVCSPPSTSVGYTILRRSNTIIRHVTHVKHRSEDTVIISSQTLTRSDPVSVQTQTPPDIDDGRRHDRRVNDQRELNKPIIINPPPAHTHSAAAVRPAMVRLLRRRAISQCLVAGRGRSSHGRRSRSRGADMLIAAVTHGFHASRRCCCRC